MELEDLYSLLCSGHVQAQGIVDVLPMPLVVLDQDLRITTANPAFLSAFRVDRDATIGRSVFTLGNGQWDIAQLRTLLVDVIPKAAAVIDYEVTHEFPGIGERTMLVGARKLAEQGGAGRHIVMIFEDITERGRATAAKDILLAETNHRMRNLLGVVRALASQTQAEGRSGEEYRDTLLGRLDTLSRAQDVSLAGESDTDLASFLIRAVEPIEPERTHVGPGPSVRLAAEQILPLSLILHELGTNSLKYGALSAPGGIVRVSWDVAGHESGATLLLDWREEGGPSAKQPERRGFGTRLIEFSACTSLGGAVKLCFGSGGLHVRISVPLNQDSPRKDPPWMPPQAQTPERRPVTKS